MLADDFSLYLHMPTITDPSLAPEGGETFYVLSPVPHLGADIDWTTAAKPYRDLIMQFLEDNYLPDLQENIVVEHLYRSAVLPEHAQHAPGLGLFRRADPDAVGLVPPAQPVGRF